MTERLSGSVVERSARMQMVQWLNPVHNRSKSFNQVNKIKRSPTVYTVVPLDVVVKDAVGHSIDVAPMLIHFGIYSKLIYM